MLVLSTLLPDSGFAQFKFSETLPVLPPSEKEHTIVVPLDNVYDKAISIDSTKASCTCSRDLKFSTSPIEKGGSTTIEVHFKVFPTAQEIELNFDVYGHKVDSDEKDNSRQLASYHLEIPIREEVSLEKRTSSFDVREGAPSRCVIVNSTRWKWGSLAVLTDIEGISVNAVIEERIDYQASTQKVTLELSGAGKFLSAKDKPREINLRFFATHGSHRTSLYVGQLKIPLRLISGIEVFPKKLVRNDDGTWQPFNIVGRAVDIGDFASKLSLRFGGSELIVGTDIRIDRLSPKLLRVRVLNLQTKELVNITQEKIELRLDDIGWQDFLPLN